MTDTQMMVSGEQKFDPSPSCPKYATKIERMKSTITGEHKNRQHNCAGKGQRAL